MFLIAPASLAPPVKYIIQRAVQTMTEAHEKLMRRRRRRRKILTLCPASPAGPRSP